MHTKYLVLVSVFCVVMHVHARQENTPSCTVYQVQGDVFAVNKKGQRRPLQNGARLFAGELVHTGEKSSATIRFGTDFLTVSSSSVVRVQALDRSYSHATNLFILNTGKVRLNINKSLGQVKSFIVRTPIGTAAARGTEYTVGYFEELGMYVHVFSGMVEVKLPDKETRFISSGYYYFWKRR